ncbi:hypothetical protein [Thermodesulfatator autotrophicus]|uniref:Uncharacterized protein n=1 Tax=Thermodesulfatator autotrophicus TaxID=1795632 RepID=A0A177EC94_9BACT|nr:hypothetical protein [Thermodesulfatator autotrophicus]OAG28619.1 hypothetical protein TH606_00530 [Thermodesulfatator autotrophicus]
MNILLLWLPIIMAIIITGIKIWKIKNFKIYIPNTKYINIEDLSIKKEIKNISNIEINKQKIFLFKTNKEEKLTVKKALKLSGIITINSQKICILNGKFLKENEEINSIKIKKILDKEVIVEIDNKEENIKIGQLKFI